MKTLKHAGRCLYECKFCDPPPVTDSSLVTRSPQQSTSNDKNDSQTSKIRLKFDNEKTKCDQKSITNDDSRASFKSNLAVEFREHLEAVHKERFKNVADVSMINNLQIIYLCATVLYVILFFIVRRFILILRTCFFL